MKKNICLYYNCNNISIYGYTLGCNIFCKDHAFNDMIIVKRECCISNDLLSINEI